MNDGVVPHKTFSEFFLYVSLWSQTMDRTVKCLCNTADKQMRAESGVQQTGHLPLTEWLLISR